METTTQCPACGHQEAEPFSDCSKCGIIIAKYYKRQQVLAEKKAEAEKPVSCPKCESTQLSANKKGFSVGKAIGGALILGPLGLAGGFAGSNDIKLTCIKCGHNWQVTPQQ
jgi:ssDNA-binding Zn-finger/Zn-ribbon topoisomerase 1